MDASNIAKVLRLTKPWFVSDVSFDHEHELFNVTIDNTADKLRCPKCDKLCSRYDTRRSQWRHLNMMEYESVVVCDIPRIRCKEHGILQVNVPWSERFGRYTHNFERYVITLLEKTSISGVAELVNMNWNAVSKIMERAVARGLTRRAKSKPVHISIDETSFQKRHEYVTVITNQETGAVEFVADGHDEKCIHPYFEKLGKRGCKRLKTVSMDMWEGFINAAQHFVDDAESKICFDKFHVAQHIGKGLDQVRRSEHRQLLQDDDTTLKGTKYLWLMNPENMSKTMDERFQKVRDSSLRTADAWAIKEHAMMLWYFKSRTWAIKAWEHWIEVANATGLVPIMKAAATVANRLWGIINAIVHKRTNAIAESINSRIQRAKAMARGFRNRARFRTVIFFHCGQLDLFP